MGQKLPDEYYNSRWKKIVNVMKNSNIKLSKIAEAGSRAKKPHRPDSDMDVIFSISENPTRTIFYPQLIKILGANFSGENIQPGKYNNIINFYFRNGGKFDLLNITHLKNEKIEYV